MGRKQIPAPQDRQGISNRKEQISEKKKKKIHHKDARSPRLLARQTFLVPTQLTKSKAPSFPKKKKRSRPIEGNEAAIYAYPKKARKKNIPYHISQTSTFPYPLICPSPLLKRLTLAQTPPTLPTPPTHHTGLPLRPTGAHPLQPLNQAGLNPLPLLRLHPNSAPTPRSTSIPIRNLLDTLGRTTTTTTTNNRVPPLAPLPRVAIPHFARGAATDGDLGGTTIATGTEIDGLAISHLAFDVELDALAAVDAEGDFVSGLAPLGTGFRPRRRVVAVFVAGAARGGAFGFLDVAVAACAAAVFAFAAAGGFGPTACSLSDGFGRDGRRRMRPALRGLVGFGLAFEFARIVVGDGTSVLLSGHGWRCGSGVFFGSG